MITRKIHIKGIVQGVGFRPFVYNTANAMKVKGWVKNSSAGVEIVATAAPEILEQFQTRIQKQPPPLAKIDQFQIEEVGCIDFEGFEIKQSEVIPGEFIPISPDIAICADCTKELFNPQDKRYRYPFINCTNCGPRLTIIKDIPYDRPNTTMDIFPMCDFCESEYKDPGNRRFHAQPVACATCGPRVLFQTTDGIKTFDESGIEKARELIRDGKIIAIKGLGGFHLACDALNPEAVALLRTRKKRSQKPFAVMSFDIQGVEEYCELTEGERRLILSREKPIVIVSQKQPSSLPEELAPGRNTIGIMLAYTPLHLLLLEPEKGFPDLLVMTSGNTSEEPIAFTNDQALQELQHIADGFLLNDRDIFTRVDDSVVSEFKGNPYFFRRARGFAPRSIKLSVQPVETLGVGAELKNTFCLTRDDYAFVSHHIGDLKNHETYSAFSRGINHYQKLFKISPEVIACDCHPDYISTKYARRLAESQGLPLFEIQHHHAHLASCLVDNGIFDDKPVIGVIFDGTGFGLDGNIWGGEILVGNTSGFTREFHLENMPLPGGDKAVENPNRIALAYLLKNDMDLDPSLPSISSIPVEQKNILMQQIKANINVPFTSSMGRLFDAVASLSGLRQHITYEAQAAIELEQIIDPEITDAYQFEIIQNRINFANLLKSVVNDVLNNVDKSVIAAKFHNAVVDLVVQISLKLRKEKNINTIALSGGVWQNLFLLNQSVNKIRAQGFEVLVHKNVPANDGGISLGQVAIAQAMIKK